MAKLALPAVQQWIMCIPVCAWKHPHHLLFIINGCTENRHVSTVKEGKGKKRKRKKSKRKKRNKKVCEWENKDEDGNCEFWSVSAEGTQLQSAASNSFHLNASKHKSFMWRHLKIIVRAGYQAKWGEESEWGQEQSQEISNLVTRQMTRILYSELNTD